MLWTRPRRAIETVEATRWLFLVLALASLPLALPALLTTPNDTMLPAALAGTVVLGLSWSAGYIHKSAPLGMDVLDAVAILAFALACPEPGATLGFVFSALWFRSLYGSMRQAVLRWGLYVGALSASLLLWPLVPGHAGGTEIGPLAGAFPTMLLTVVVARHLGESLRTRGQSDRRDVVHASAGTKLLGVTDPAEIGRIAWMTISGICAATPGLRVLKVVRAGGVLSVDGAAGGFAYLPETLPATSLWVRGGHGEAGREKADSATELDGAAGTHCIWVALPMPDVYPETGGGAWLLIGSPGEAPAEAIDAIDALVTQVALALSNGAALQKLTLQATLDSLTGLVNRASFNAGLSAALEDESSRDTTVLFVDLDDFKGVNDMLGHGAGDDLLQEVAARLCRATRPQDVCARLGGDEFAVLLLSTGTVVAAEVAQRIVQSIAEGTHVGGGVVHVSASVGVATATNETGLEELLHRADVAMYAAKTSGKGRIKVFESGLLQGDSTQRVFDQQLAAAATNGELVVHYQPVLTLPDERCSAVEALVRWQHPQRGLLHPESFIEDAERIGAISDIGAYVLRRACEDSAIWREAQPSCPLAIHVNISALQLDDAGFIDIVTRCLTDFALPPDQLVLEVTETIVISSPAAIDRLNLLAALGVTIAIDDFGTGYSALTTLRSLPAQIVKIDKSFVAGCTGNPLDRAVIEAVVKMAAQMGMQTIAEGVEFLEQGAFLEGIGTNAVQGHLYLPPTTAQEFSTWFGGHLAGLSQIRPTSDVVPSHGDGLPVGRRPLHLAVRP